MDEGHFYVENARLMSEGLSRLGEGAPLLESSCRTPPALAGSLIAAGLMAQTESGNEHYLDHHDSFVRRAAIIGLGLSGYLGREEASRTLAGRLAKGDCEEQKVALLSYGLSGLGKGDDEKRVVLAPFFRHDHWKIRSAAGLAHSMIFQGDTSEFAASVENLRSEENPYVKVCSCWYVSMAFAGTNEGLQEYGELLRLPGEENSFFRDMAALGLGYSFLGTANEKIDDMLEQIIRTDPHPYVRESACFGLALNHLQLPTERSTACLNGALTDTSTIVRSGAALAHGIQAIGTGTLESRAMNDDRSVAWGLAISEGLALLPPTSMPEDTYARWGWHIGNGFREKISVEPGSPHVELREFQERLNVGLKNAPLSGSEAQSFRLFFPGFYHYAMYDSFWWGLWVLSGLGHTLNLQEAQR